MSMSKNINNEEELNKSSSLIKVDWSIWVDSEVIQCECEDCGHYFNGNETDECPACESDNIILEWNWEGVECGLGCGAVGDCDERHGYFEVSGEDKEKLYKHLTEKQITQIEDYSGMICMKCATNLSNICDWGSDEFELEDVLSLFNDHRR